MKVNSMHACIERKMVGDIYTPRDYTVIMETSRIYPAPYNVKPMNFADFKKFNGNYITSIRPGKKSGNPATHDLRALEYNPDGQVRFKLKFGSESQWNILPQRIRIPEEPFEWTDLFKGPVPISKRKFDDLQSMKQVLPQYCHHYFDSLPHQHA